MPTKCKPMQSHSTPPAIKMPTNLCQILTDFKNSFTSAFCGKSVITTSHHFLTASLHYLMEYKCKKN